MTELPSRFWSKVATDDDGCWLWTGALNRGGYGVYRVYPNGTQLAHRVAYIALVGDLPADRPHLDHLCRVRSCVRPDHLEPVTNRENVIRGVGFIAQQVKRTHCPQGHPYDAENTVRENGKRHCLACRRGRRASA